MLQKARTSKDRDVQRQVTFGRPALIALPPPGAKTAHVASLFFSKSFGKLGHGHCSGSPKSPLHGPYKLPLRRRPRSRWVLRCPC